MGDARDAREIEFVTSFTEWDGYVYLGWSANMPTCDIHAMLDEEEARDRARRLEILSDPARSIAPKESTVNPQHQDETRER